MKNLATVKMVQNILNGTTPIASKALLNSVCPVGRIYISADETSPAEIYGGTWERIAGRFLLGVAGGGRLVS